jgi:hypothetical protein
METEMAVEVKQAKSEAQKIAERLRNSGEGSNPNVHTKHGEGPLRTHTNIHHSGHYVQPNTQAKPTAGVVDYPDEAAVKGGDASSVSGGARGRAGFPHGDRGGDR